MKIGYLGILLVLLLAVLGLLFYLSQNAEPLSEPIQPSQYVITEGPDTIIEQVTGESGIESVGVTETVPAVIHILFNSFTPKILTVAPGTTVVWVNSDVNVHQIKEQSAQNLFRSDRLMPNSSFIHVFNEPGEFHYIDTINTYMQGKVIVIGPSPITGNVIGFIQNPTKVGLLALFVLTGLLLIYVIEQKR
ncbi:MAG TPA: cupredoxin domain-containing protein [Candidatus Nanoarchaeia archaeon]|nr:cupredoxin domain-containing protein [Candidatus Nanoarchaeia archaeon]